jgi:hypothetical protein
LEKAIREYGAGDLDHAGMLGELGVVYLRQGLSDKVKQLFNEQHALSVQIAEKARAAGPERRKAAWRAGGLICRAVGYKGILAYQPAVPNFYDGGTVNKALLDEAIEFNTERVQRAEVLLGEIVDEDTTLKKEIMANTRHCVALDSLTLCYSILGEPAKSSGCGKKSLEVGKSFDPTIQALGRFYYGLALDHNEKRKEAMEQWKMFGEGNRCTAAIALCKEPSDENIEWLKQLVRRKVPMSTYDEQGYSALYYAVMGNSAEMEAVVAEGFRQELLDSDLTEEEAEIYVEARKTEAHRRRENRSIFQRSFRPFLRANALPDPRVVGESQQASGKSKACIRQLRHEYMNLLVSSGRARLTFDQFEYILLSDFRTKLGKLPRLGSGEDVVLISQLTHTYDTQKDDPYIVFFSYRWLGQAAPDDESHTQYKRMNQVIDLFLKKHPWLDPEKMGIWLVKSSNLSGFRN